MPSFMNENTHHIGVEKFEDNKNTREERDEQSQRTTLLSDLFGLPAWKRFCQNFQETPETLEKTLKIIIVRDQEDEKQKEKLIDFILERQKWLKETVDALHLPDSLPRFNKEKRWDEFFMDVSDLTNFVHEYGKKNEPELTAEETERVQMKIAMIADRQRKKEELAMAWQTTIVDDRSIMDETVQMVEDLCKNPELAVIPRTRREMVKEHLVKNAIIKKGSTVTPIKIIAEKILAQVAKLPLTFNHPQEETQIEMRIKSIMKNVTLSEFHQKNTKKAA